MGTLFKLKKTANNRFRASLLIAALVGTMPMMASAEVPTDASIDKMMQVVQAEKMGQQMIQQMSGSFAQTFENMKLNDNLTPEQDKELNGIVSQFMQDIMSDIASDSSIGQMMTYYKDAAKQTYTQAEVDAMIDFYGSAEGQSIIVKQPIVMQSYMQKVQPFMTQSIQKMQHTVIPEFDKKMKAFASKHGLDK